MRAPWVLCLALSAGCDPSAGDDGPDDDGLPEHTGDTAPDSAASDTGSDTGNDGDTADTGLDPLVDTSPGDCAPFDVLDDLDVFTAIGILQGIRGVWYPLQNGIAGDPSCPTRSEVVLPSGLEKVAWVGGCLAGGDRRDGEVVATQLTPDDQPVQEDRTVFSAWSAEDLPRWGARLDVDGTLDEVAPGIGFTGVAQDTFRGHVYIDRFADRAPEGIGLDPGTFRWDPQDGVEWHTWGGTLDFGCSGVLSGTVTIGVDAQYKADNVPRLGSVDVVINGRHLRFDWGSGGDTYCYAAEVEGRSRTVCNPSPQGS